jgi:hypothetical protein
MLQSSELSSRLDFLAEVHDANILTRQPTMLIILLMLVNILASVAVP